MFYNLHTEFLFKLQLWKVTHLTFEKDPEPYGRIRDHNISTMAQENGITVINRTSHTLYCLEK